MENLRVYWRQGCSSCVKVKEYLTGIGVEFESIDEGTRFTHVEHGAFFDQFWADGPNREAGSRGLLDVLGNYLA